MGRHRRFFPRLALGALFAVGAVAGCRPTFAPPPRAALGPVPMQVEVTGDSTGMSVGWLVDPGARSEVEVADDINWDADLSRASLRVQTPMIIGSPGLRYFLASARPLRIGLADGGTLGWGGLVEELYANDLISGAFAGVDVGVPTHRLFGFYTSGRYLISGGTGDMPLTHWGIAGLGLQGDWAPFLFTTVEVGGYWYRAMPGFEAGGPYANLTLGVRWGWQEPVSAPPPPAEIEAPAP